MDGSPFTLRSPLKIKDKGKSDFVSLTENKAIWEEVLNTSERSAILVAAAAFDTQLERILLTFLIADSAVSKRIVEASSFAQKINLCFALGLISDDERHDLDILRVVRNAFSHNIFGCDFGNAEVVSSVSSLRLARKAAGTPEVKPRLFFNIGMITLDSLLRARLAAVGRRAKMPNTKFAKEGG